MYILIICAVLFVFFIETKDVNCPTQKSTREECSKYGGMAYSYTNPEINDSCNTLLNKIDKAGKADLSMIKWRKAFTLGFLISIVMWILVITPGRLPIWTTFYVCVIVTFAMLYIYFNLYSTHVYNNVYNNIHDTVEMLKSKGVCNNIS